MSFEAFEEDEYEYVEQDDLEQDEEDRLDAIEASIEVAERDRQINKILADFEEDEGITLSRATGQQVGALVDAGWDVTAAWNEVSPEAQNFEADFDAAIEKIEAKEGRTLLDSEVSRIWENAVDEGDPEHVEGTLDLNDKSQLEDYIDGRLGGESNAPEAVAPLEEDATPDEIGEYLEARSAGAEIATEGDESYE